MSDHLSDLVESVLTELQKGKLIDISEDEFTLTPLNLGMIGSHYYLSYSTMELFDQSFTAKTKLRVRGPGRRATVSRVQPAALLACRPFMSGGVRQVLACLCWHCYFSTIDRRPTWACHQGWGCLVVQVSSVPSCSIRRSPDCRPALAPAR